MRYSTVFHDYFRANHTLVDAVGVEPTLLQDEVDSF